LMGIRQSGQSERGKKLRPYAGRLRRAKWKETSLVLGEMLKRKEQYLPVIQKKKKSSTGKRCSMDFRESNKDPVLIIRRRGDFAKGVKTWKRKQLSFGGNL